MRISGLAAFAPLSLKINEIDSGSQLAARYRFQSSPAFIPSITSRNRFTSILKSTSSENEINKLEDSIVPQLDSLPKTIQEADHSQPLKGIDNVVNDAAKVPPSDVLEAARKAKVLAAQFNDHLRALRETLAEMEKLAPLKVVEELQPLERSVGKMGRDTFAVASSVKKIVEGAESLAKDDIQLISEIGNEIKEIKDTIEGTQNPIKLLTVLPAKIENIREEIESDLGTNLQFIKKIQALFELATEIITDARTVGALITVLFDHILNRAQPVIDHAITQIQPVADQVAAQAPVVESIVQKLN